MGFALSPSVNIKEIDLTLTIPAVATSIAAAVGNFQWGPVEEITLVDSEKRLVELFGLPDDNTFEDWFPVANFLGYSNNLKLVRAVGASALNAIGQSVIPVTGKPVIADDNDGTATASTSLLKNLDDFSQQASFQAGCPIIAKYPGTFSNNKLKVYAINGAYIENTEVAREYAGLGTITNTAFDASAGTITATGATFVTAGLKAGDAIEVASAEETLNNGTYTIVSVDSETVLTVKETIAYTNATDTAATIAIRNTLGTISSVATAADTPIAGQSTLTLTTTATLNAATNTFTAGDKLVISNSEDLLNDGTWTIVSVGASTIVVTGTLVVNADDTTMTMEILANPATQWATFSQKDEFDYAPEGNDIHVLVEYDNNIVERFYGSQDKTAVSSTGGTKYYVEAINRTSKYIWIPDDQAADTGLSFQNNGTTSAYYDGTLTTGYSVTPVFYEQLMAGGVDDAPILADYQTGWDLFADAEAIDINLALQAGGGTAVGKYILENIAEVRKDCVAFMSPDLADVVGTATPNADTIALRDAGGVFATSSSYGVIAGNYKYQYDKYNDKYRWVALNGDVAGTCAYTDDVRDPWWSPAGFNRGHIKNVVKLAYNPTRAQRDELYKAGINPVVSFKGEGTVLFGDKTAQTKPSAFDRINVRRLFIVLEKAIATAAKYQLFEFNDRITRNNFVNMVEPFLRDVKGRRGIYDFRVVCDESNNTGEVIDRNEFVADIYIKPARSINFIYLNFVAVKTGVDFEEVLLTNANVQV